MTFQGYQKELRRNLCPLSYILYLNAIPCYSDFNKQPFRSLHQIQYPRKNWLNVYMTIGRNYYIGKQPMIRFSKTFLLFPQSMMLCPKRTFPFRSSYTRIQIFPNTVRGANWLQGRNLARGPPRIDCPTPPLSIPHPDSPSNTPNI